MNSNEQNLESLSEDLENELLWRLEEFSFFKNILTQYKIKKKEIYIKGLLLILYSHFEGYFKNALLVYIDYINKLNFICDEINYNLMALSIENEFKLYENLDGAGKYFKNKLPEEQHLKRFSRRIDFLENLENFNKKKVLIKDTVIDTKSNLNYQNLQLNLFKLGIPEDLFSDYKNDINKLVNLRNNIAHGQKIENIKEEDFQSLEESVIYVMKEIKRKIFFVAKNEEFMRKK